MVEHTEQIAHAEQITTGGVNVADIGHVMAELNDWRAITFVLVVVIIILLVERFWTLHDSRAERRETLQLAREFAESAGKVAEALNALRQEISSLRAAASHLEEILHTTRSRLRTLVPVRSTSPKDPPIYGEEV